MQNSRGDNVGLSLKESLIYGLTVHTTDYEKKPTLDMWVLKDIYDHTSSKMILYHPNRKFVLKHTIIS